MTAAPATPALPTTRPAGCPFDPPGSYATLRETAPTSKVRCPAGMDAWLVTRYADVRAVLADRTMSSRGASSVHVNPNADLDEEVHPGSIIQLDGAAHSRLRKKVLAEFTVRRVEALRGYVRQLVESHLDAMLAQAAPADLVRDFALPIPSLVICELLGVPYADRSQFQRQSTTLVSTDATREEGEQAYDALSGYLAELFTEKQRNPQEDLFSRLSAAGADDPLTMEELVVLGLSLLVAGHETTANMIALSTLVLLEHPGQREAVLAAPERAVEELLRYLSVVQWGVLRYATEDVRVGSREVRAGEWLVAALNSANRDEPVFPGADKLDFDREHPRTHVAFGFGAHQCVGQQLARVELQEALTGLFRRVPDLRLAVPREELAYKHNTLVYGVRELPVAWG
ncbi:cytochrome P450 [Amycolatopsis mediterranei S699]|uniref:Cytochrome P450 n=2 Tax=Amycolatopsis mediterranei TaxID=33910 RepID=A0A0H3CYI5_AMYMU|nr:cytochrome P450 [Amycolatopsis mediterranei]ADJ43145.1 cytochrome P450 [Amycolatopsis mediterranei U32]AEK39842.1 cytochrome P450 [Amycolatopsis mediterranei S699]AFO74859.1 cytochrome P450 [Amycolatopsis mediterranei S699]AGT81988.1 cytochrome P450 [Amycolatopsis mediterranei RB]KDO05055.1 cytochrome P450 [Amycolatopsis mediterranei]